MIFRKTIARAAAGLILSVQPAAAASESAGAPVAAADRALPQVLGPIPVTAQSRPFLGAPAAAIQAAGYVEEEYFLSGNANTYD
ncbi:hypothetical protein KRR38_00250 [Novosphingobium sp. G106]|uniref:alpha/beta hydrolase domain-containing protein n=1 Tax=Novosphingobium sp. G106 TaxID=2849500 RepID=UPI001C2D0FF7|nr:alpha/beta hydrolase domain-containing protein [Novosphingobium sp. G106]MBV1686141.1 hypothetical protein [Novosphingobium sp. G106]